MDKQNEILAALATGYQRVSDRQEVIEDVFKDSVIIPGSKLSIILTAAVLLGVALCFSFCFVWYYGG